MVLLGRKTAPRGFGWILRIDDGWAKIGVTVPTAATSRLRQILATTGAEAFVDVGRGRLRTSPIPVGCVHRSVAERVLLVGESAGQVKATSHGGIYYGMLGARLAARTLEEALRRDDLSEARLGSYETRWRALLEPEIRTGIWLRRRMGLVGDLCLAGLMSLGGSDNIMRWVRDNADFDWHRPLIQSLREGWSLPKQPDRQEVESVLPQAAGRLARQRT